MPPRIDHRKPVVAFAVLLAVAAAVIGINLRASALPGRWFAAGLLSAGGPAAEGTVAAPGPSVPARTDPGRSSTSENALAGVILDSAPASPEPAPRPARSATGPTRSLLHRPAILHRPSIRHRLPAPATDARTRPHPGRAGQLMPPGLSKRDVPGAGPHGRGPALGHLLHSAGGAVRGLAEHPGLGRLVVRR